MADAAALEWDKSGSRYYELGIYNCALYVANGTGYGTGVAWNGITSVTESPEGAEANDLYADNMKYAVLRSDETFKGTIEAYTYPDEFMVCDGTASPVKGVYVGQQSRTAFGLAYKTKVGNDTQDESDDGYKLHIIWNATASPSERQYETINDSPDAITFSWEFETTPVTCKVGNTTYKPMNTIIIDTTKLDTDGKAKLETLEEKLFGSTTAAAALPTPSEVLTTMGMATT